MWASCISALAGTTSDEPRFRSTLELSKLSSPLRGDRGGEGGVEENGEKLRTTPLPLGRREKSMRRRGILGRGEGKVKKVNKSGESGMCSASVPGRQLSGTFDRGGGGAAGGAVENPRHVVPLLRFQPQIRRKKG